MELRPEFFEIAVLNVPERIWLDSAEQGRRRYAALRRLE